jgi:hypothetical protein
MDAVYMEDAPMGLTQASIFDFKALVRETVRSPIMVVFTEAERGKPRVYEAVVE